MQSTPLPPRGDFRELLQREVTPLDWNTWLKSLRVRREGNRLHVDAPTDFHRHWVSQRLLDPIVAAAHAAFGPDIAVELGLYDGANAVPAPTPLLVTDDAPARTVAAAPAPPAPVYDLEARLVPRYTFDNFVVGQSNRFAWAAAMAVGEQSTPKYNPLFIYGPAGLGKTHLLHAVGHQRREIAPASVIRYVSSEQFLNEFIHGIRRGQTSEFQDRYRKVDVLLIDDVQFLEGKEAILEEFFHTFNTLHESGKQLVIGSDRKPKSFVSIEDRFRSRFEWGLLTDIQPPDVETRLAILRKNAEHASRPVPEDVLRFIAERVMDNVRELEGALTRVTAFASVNNERITLQLAQEVLQYLTDDQGRQITPELVMERVAARYGLPLADLTGSSRKQPLAVRRQIAMYLCRELTNLSLPKIGAAFGGRDHTTVIHAVERVRILMQSDKTVFDEVTSLCKDLRKS